MRMKSILHSTSPGVLRGAALFGILIAGLAGAGVLRSQQLTPPAARARRRCNPLARFRGLHPEVRRCRRYPEPLRPVRGCPGRAILRPHPRRTSRSAFCRRPQLRLFPRRLGCLPRRCPSPITIFPARSLTKRPIPIWASRRGTMRICCATSTSNAPPPRKPSFASANAIAASDASRKPARNMPASCGNSSINRTSRSKACGCSPAHRGRLRCPPPWPPQAAPIGADPFQEDAQSIQDQLASYERQMSMMEQSIKVGAGEGKRSRAAAPRDPQDSRPASRPGEKTGHQPSEGPFGGGGGMVGYSEPAYGQSGAPMDPTAQHSITPGNQPGGKQDAARPGI